MLSAHTFRSGATLTVGAVGMAFMALPVLADPVAQGGAIATTGSGNAIACVTCHGAQGEGMQAAGFPYLAGQGASYLTEQLEHFAQGRRRNAIMEPIAKALDAGQMAAVSQYYSELPRPFDEKALAAMIDTYPKADAMGAWLANRGDWDNNIAACVQCHGPGGIGVGPTFPALAGLPANYLRQQLMDWKQESRDPGPLSLMGDIARRMSEAQIDAVADYFAALPDTAQSRDASAVKGAK